MPIQSPEPTRITLILRAADGQSLESILPFVQNGAHVSIGRGLAVIDQMQQPPALDGKPEALVSLIVRDLCETEPDDFHDAVHVRMFELKSILTRHVTQLQSETDEAVRLGKYSAACGIEAEARWGKEREQLQAEVEQLRSALKFYADSEHYHFESGNWDTVSGEPLNILWCGDEPDFIEDGSIARAALAEGEKLPTQHPDTARLDFMLLKCRKVVIERVPEASDVYVEEGFMSDTRYSTVTVAGEWSNESESAAKARRNAIDLAMTEVRND